MTRIDHVRDPHAPDASDIPVANSIVVAVTAFVRDPDGRVLLIRRTDSGLWALPGGAQEIGEDVTGTAIRETREESGIEIEVTGLVGIYSSPYHVIEFSDGEIRQQFSICFRARPVGGQAATSDESSDVRWVTRVEAGALPIHVSMQLRIEHGYADRPQPYLG